MRLENSGQFEERWGSLDSGRWEGIELENRDSS
jgi:hypothetical protein